MFVDASPSPAELSSHQLEFELVDLAARINAATCRWLELAAEFDRRGAHEPFGFASCATWLAWRCSLTPRAAREQLRVARSLAELPLTRAEFAAGRLSYSKVRALTRVAEGADEADLIELAHASTAAQLERLLRAYRTATADSDKIAAERRHLSTRWEDDGTLTIRGNLPPDEGALMLKALELAREELFACFVADAEDDGATPAAPAKADALLALAETAISRGVQAASGGDRHQVVIHVDTAHGDSKTDETAPGQDGSAKPPAIPPVAIGPATIDGSPLSPNATRRLACDASIVTLVEHDGVPLSVGRKTRSIPPAIRRALASRDRCCGFPGCEQERFVDAHHLVHWADGGETSLDNLVLLCRRHHRLLHEGGVTIRGNAASPQFHRADGSLIDPAPDLPKVDARRAVARFKPDSELPWGKGEEMDLDLAVFALANRWSRRHDEADGPPVRPPPFVN